MLTEQLLKNRSQFPVKAIKLHLVLLKYQILCADDLLYSNWHWFIQCEECRYPNPMHNTKINDFDVKWAILMLTEQLLKNRSQLHGKAKKLHLVILKYEILCTDDLF